MHHSPRERAHQIKINKFLIILTLREEKRHKQSVARSGQAGEVTNNKKNPIIDNATWNTPGQNSQYKGTQVCCQRQGEHKNRHISTVIYLFKHTINKNPQSICRAVFCVVHKMSLRQCCVTADSSIFSTV